MSFRQWSDEFSSWVERIDQDFEKMLRLAAQMQEWDKDKSIAEFDKHIYLAMKRLTAGIAREIVDTSKTAGDCARRNRHSQSTPRIEATYSDSRIFSPAEYDREFARRSPKEPMSQRHHQSGQYEKWSQRPSAERWKHRWT